MFGNFLRKKRDSNSVVIDWKSYVDSGLVLVDEGGNVLYLTKIPNAVNEFTCLVFDGEKGAFNCYSYYRKKGDINA